MDKRINDFLTYILIDAEELSLIKKKALSLLLNLTMEAAKSSRNVAGTPVPAATYAELERLYEIRDDDGFRRKVPMIKLFRQETNLGLLESKTAIETHWDFSS